MPTVMVTFVKATYVLAIFVHIRNISIVTDPILTKLFWPNFFQPNIFFAPKIIFEHFFTRMFSDPTYFSGLNSFVDSNKFLDPNFYFFGTWRLPLPKKFGFLSWRHLFRQHIYWRHLSWQHMSWWHFLFYFKTIILIRRIKVQDN